MTRLLRAGVAAFILLATTGVVSANGQAAAEACPALGPSGWRSALAPEFPHPPASTPATMSLLVADQGSSTRLLTTDGLTTFRTDDAGCTWRRVHDLGAPPVTGGAVGGPRVVAAVVPQPGHLRLLLHDAQAEATTVRLVVSDDDGRTWSDGGEGLPLVAASSPRCAGRADCGLVIGGDGKALYWYGVPAAGRSTVVYRSEDGGRTFARRIDRESSDPIAATPLPAASPLGGGPTIVQLLADPLDAKQLWALQDNGSLSRSADGAASWVNVRYPAGRSGDTQLTLTTQVGVTRVTVLGRTRTSTWRATSADGGRAFSFDSPLGLAGTLLSAAEGPEGLVATTTEGIYRLDGTGRFRSVDGLRLSPAEVIGHRGSELVFRSRDRVAMWQPPVAAFSDAALPPAGDALSGMVPGLPQPPIIPPVSGATLAPEGLSVNLTPGQKATVPYVLRAPPQHRSLDVFILTDTSGSMGSAINGIASSMRELATALRESGIDARFGLGEFNEGIRYNRLRDLGPADKEFDDALVAAQERGRGGRGTIGGEAPLTALHQMATGAGVLSPKRGPIVPKGLGASFRPAAMRVVVNVADEDFYEDPDGPDRPTTYAALNRVGVRHVGLYIARGGDDGPLDRGFAQPQGTLEADLKALSVATSSLAPPGGVDCNDDFTVDIVAGAPLVCPVRDDEAGDIRLAGLLTRLLMATGARAPVDVVGDGMRRAKVTAAPVYPSVDLSRAHQLPFAVTFTCGPGSTTTTETIRIVARAGGAAMVAVPARVTCAGVPIVAAPVLPLTPLVGPTPPPAAQAPASAGATAQVPQPAASGALAVAPQPEVQLAQQGQGFSGDDQQFSRVRTSAPFGPDEARFAGAAALCLAAVAVALRRQRADLVLVTRDRRL